MALTGTLHGMFHLPIVFFTPFYHPDGNRLLIAVLFVAVFTIGGLLYGYLRLTTGSLWPVSLAHSAHKYFWVIFASMTVGGSAIVSEYIAGEAGVLPIIGYGLLAICLLRRLPEAQGEAAARPGATKRAGVATGLARGADPFTDSASLFMAVARGAQ
jgi:CAAX protease family protein